LVRLVESASDEVARLDALCAVAPAAVSEHLRLAAFVQLAATPEGTPFAHDSLAAATIDTVHAALVPSDAARWIHIASAEEQRARSGAPLTASRVLGWMPEAGSADLAALDHELRPGGATRAVLLRAVSVAAMLRTRVPTYVPASDLVPALILCAAGNTDRLRLLPFAALDPAARAESLAAWDEGDEAPFAQLALAECARVARAERQAVIAALTGVPAEDARLDTLGRAAIMARRALHVLRHSLGTTVPLLAAELACSRPAASAALDRLIELELAREITGRARDRVFVWSVVQRPS
jgi:hypothetical protein